jgi:hypothetical protein
MNWADKHLLKKFGLTKDGNTRVYWLPLVRATSFREAVFIDYMTYKWTDRKPRRPDGKPGPYRYRKSSKGFPESPATFHNQTGINKFAFHRLVRKYKRLHILEIEPVSGRANYYRVKMKKLQQYLERRMIRAGYRVVSREEDDDPDMTTDELD